MDIKSFIFSLFEHQKCVSCKQDGHFFCMSCINKIEEYKPYCYVCKKYSHDFMIHEPCQKYFLHLQSIIVLTHYRTPIIKRILKMWKYYNRPQIYKTLIHGKKNFFVSLLHENDAVLLPVPMHRLRKWKRWYNQAEKISDAISQLSDLKVHKNILQKRKYTKQQSKLDVSHREKNLTGSYDVNKKVKIHASTHIYLVDDIVSSGSTLKECASVLHKSWFQKISAICLASD